MTALGELARTAAEIDAGLKVAMSTLVAGAGEAPQLAGPMARLAEYALRPGKRLRGALVRWAARAAGDESASLFAAIALELYHLNLLVLDDIMDGDRVRRGKPALHAMLAEDFASEQTGVSVAITLAGMLHASALNLAAARSADAVIGLWAFMEAEVNAGQALDVIGTARREHGTEYASSVRRLKTTGYSFRWPLHIGWVLGGGESEQMPFAEYAEHAGEAFQIADDVLGAFGDPAQTGKPAGADLRAGRPSAVVALAQELEPQSLRAVLAGTEDVADLLAKLRARQVLERCTEAARAAAARAKAALQGAPIPEDVRSLLADIADLAANRTA